MDAETEAKVLEAVAEIERGMSIDDLLAEVRSHLISSTNEFSTPVVDKKVQEFCTALLAETLPAIEAAGTPAEAWAISMACRQSFRAKLGSLREERSLEFEALDRARLPHRYRTQVKTAPTSMSVPESICDTGVMKVEELF